MTRVGEPSETPVLDGGTSPDGVGEARAFTPPPPQPKRKTFDRSLVEGPIGPAVWKLAWPTMLQNVIAGMQGIIDHAMVGHFVGYTANAAIGVSWQIVIVVIVFASSVFSGMGVLIARFAGDFCPLTSDVSDRPGIRSLFKRLTFLWAGVNAAAAATSLALLLTVPVSVFVVTAAVSAWTITCTGVVVTVADSVTTARREGVVTAVADPRTWQFALRARF